MSQLLFRNEIVEKNSSKKIKVRPGRGGNKVKGFQIDCFDKESLKQVEIEISNIYMNNSPQFSNCDDEEKCTTAMFRKFTPFNLEMENYNEKAGLDFHMHNATNSDVRVYITLTCEE